MFLATYKTNDYPSRQTVFDKHQQILDKFFDEFWGNRKHFIQSNTSYPKLNIYEDDQYFCLEIAVPGIEEKDLDVQIVKETKLFTIKSSSRNSKENNQFYHIKELKQSPFERTLQLPDYIDVDPETSFLENGILFIVFKKFVSQEIEPKETVKKISINKK